MSHTHSTVEAQQRIGLLAAQVAVHRAFHWLHLHQPQMLAWQMEFLAIAAPTFAERSRAEWFVARFAELGLTGTQIDGAGNALGELAGDEGAGRGPVLLLSAHLDTVFAEGTPTTPTLALPRILGPGACDNGAGLAALLGLAAALRFAGVVPPVPILFAANTGEEGQGDLRGMRHLFESGPYAGRVGAALALEGAGTAAAVNRALGSRRFRVTITGPGGHSWTDAAAPNPILLLAQGLARLPPVEPGAGQRQTGEAACASDGPGTTAPAGSATTTLSAGTIRGGTSINSIPQFAEVLLDLRSTEAAELDRLELELHRTFKQVMAGLRLSPKYAAPELTVDRIGDRPAAELPGDSALLSTLRAVDRHLGLRTELRLGSTDANVPLALGVPALAVAAGGTGGGIHTLAEWYDPTGREWALRRILLTLLDTAGVLAAAREEGHAETCTLHL